MFAVLRRQQTIRLRTRHQPKAAKASDEVKFVLSLFVRKTLTVRLIQASRSNRFWRMPYQSEQHDSLLVGVDVVGSRLSVEGVQRAGFWVVLQRPQINTRKEVTCIPPPGGGEELDQRGRRSEPSPNQPWSDFASSDLYCQQLMMSGDQRQSRDTWEHDVTVRTLREAFQSYALIDRVLIKQYQQLTGRTARCHTPGKYTVTSGLRS